MQMKRGSHPFGSLNLYMKNNIVHMASNDLAIVVWKVRNLPEQYLLFWRVLHRISKYAQELPQYYMYIVLW